MKEIESIEGFKWLNEILNIKDNSNFDKPAHRYLSQPSLETPQFLLPVEARKATASAVLRFSDDKAIKNRIKTLTAFLLASASVFNRFPKVAGVGNVIEIPVWDIVSFLKKELNEPEIITAITLGKPSRNRKPVLQLIKPSGETIGFAKIGWSDLSISLINNEADLLTNLESKLEPNIAAPKVILNTYWEGRKVLVISKVDSSFMSKRSPTSARDTFNLIANSLGTNHIKFKEIPLINNSNSTRIDTVINIPKLIDIHKGKIIEVGTWHGDLTPWNTSTYKNKTSIWDWEYGGTEVPVGFDQLHCEFELLRRNPAIKAATALQDTSQKARSILEDVTDHPDAVLDLYLCKLVERELMLENQRWNPKKIQLLEDLKNILDQKNLLVN